MFVGAAGPEQFSEVSLNSLSPYQQAVAQWQRQRAQVMPAHRPLSVLCQDEADAPAKRQASQAR